MNIGDWVERENVAWRKRNQEKGEAPGPILYFVLSSGQLVYGFAQKATGGGAIEVTSGRGHALFIANEAIVAWSSTEIIASETVVKPT
jgi:hypothetical protein